MLLKSAFAVVPHVRALEPLGFDQVVEHVVHPGVFERGNKPRTLELPDGLELTTPVDDVALLGFEVALVED